MNACIFFFIVFYFERLWLSAYLTMFHKLFFASILSLAAVSGASFAAANHDLHTRMTAYCRHLLYHASLVAHPSRNAASPAINLMEFAPYSSVLSSTSMNSQQDMDVFFYYSCSFIRVCLFKQRALVWLIIL